MIQLRGTKMFEKLPRLPTGLPYFSPKPVEPQRTALRRGGIEHVAVDLCTLSYWTLSLCSRRFVRLALRAVRDRGMYVALFLFFALVLATLGQYHTDMTLQYLPETHPFILPATTSGYSEVIGNSTTTPRFHDIKNDDPNEQTFHSTALSDTKTPHDAITKASNLNYFEEKYRPHYAQNTSDFFTQLKGIVSKTWKPNVTNTQEFRDRIRAELGKTGSVDNFVLTKKDTRKDQRMKFYMYGNPQKISPALWKYLPRVSPFKPRQFQSCSVVGSSGLLQGSRCGNEIDNSEFIFRFNIAPVKGFEVDVGRKTNFTTLNPSFVLHKLNSFKTAANRSRFNDILKQFRGSYLWLPPFAVSTNVLIVQQTTDIAVKSKIAVPIHGHPEHFVSVAKVWRRIANDTKTWPTTGLYVILSILDLCDRVNVFGFWPFQTALNGSNVTYHYHDDIVGMKSVHSFYTEFKQLVYLYELGIIKMFFNSCHVDGV